MKKNINLFLFLFGGIFLLILLGGCSKNIDDFPKSNLRAIAKFSFKPYHNAENNIYVEHIGVIDEVNKTIKVSLPSDAKLNGLRPYMELSPWTTVSPGNLTSIDFTKEDVELEVIAESGKKAVYSVEVTLDYVYTQAELYSVSFPGVVDETTGEPLRGVFPNFEDYVSICVTVPLGTDLKKLSVELEPTAASHNSIFAVSEDGEETYRSFDNDGIVDFSQTVIFRIISQSGATLHYKVMVKYPEDTKV